MDDTLTSDLPTQETPRNARLVMRIGITFLLLAPVLLALSFIIEHEMLASFVLGGFYAVFGSAITSLSISRLMTT